MKYLAIFIGLCLGHVLFNMAQGRPLMHEFADAAYWQGAALLTAFVVDMAGK